MEYPLKPGLKPPPITFGAEVGRDKPRHRSEQEKENQNIAGVSTKGQPHYCTILKVRRQRVLVAK
jgi:purine nucleoside permease